MRKNTVIEQDRCYHLISRLAHRAFFLDGEEKDRAVALMRRVEAGVKASMSYCINRAVSISSDPFDPLYPLQDGVCAAFVPARRRTVHHIRVDSPDGGGLLQDGADLLLGGE